ncbi:hypothetical protein GCM10022198_15780 [Klugiella xanthotipulae]|uniref:Type VII secretion integral membrane protein EccD n=1 Tax=Klugiella xanthotipulae TaxID=244735 RepID=A0A543HH03_9MICO|nr:type VII secretion integral membrane protein EccD [Klugiella xanthotipulae]TQM57615.1 type VII secretion integral membrane protein EccD [Klugiella xanthotipulae]
MTPPPSPGGTTSSLIRITVMSNDRRLDIGLPATTPLAEMIPGFARSLGVLSPDLVHGGYSLLRADTTVLDANRGLSVQSVKDGDILTLTSGALQPDPMIYDDVVEAVADAVEKQHRPWTAHDSATTALATSTAFLIAGALLLLGIGREVGLAALIAGCAALLIVTASAVLSRMNQPQAGQVLSLTAAVFGAVSGYLAVPSEAPWGWNIAAAGAGAAVVGIIAAIIVNSHKEISFIPTIGGVIIASAATVSAVTSADPGAVFAMTLAVSATLGNGIPWLALSSSRIRVTSPQTDMEIFQDPLPLNTADITARFIVGRRVQISLRAALGLVALASTPIVVASGVPGALLCTLCFVGTMLGARQTFARSDVLIVMGTGVAGLLLTGLSAALAHPEWREFLVLTLGVIATLLVGLTLLSTKPHMRLGRIADGVDLCALALLLPLGVTVARLG